MQKDNSYFVEKRITRITELGLVGYNMTLSAGAANDRIRSGCDKIKSLMAELITLRGVHTAEFMLQKKENDVNEALIQLGYEFYNMFVDGVQLPDDAAAICREIRALNDSIIKQPDGRSPYLYEQNNAGEVSGNKYGAGVSAEAAPGRNNVGQRDAASIQDQSIGAADAKLHGKPNAQEHSVGAGNAEIPDIITMPMPKALNRNGGGDVGRDPANSAEYSFPPDRADNAGGNMDMNNQATEDTSFKVNFPYGMESIPEDFIKCKCGYRNRSVAFFCGKCGRKLQRKRRAINGV